MAVTTLSDLGGLYNTIYDDALFVAREMNLMTNLVTNVGATGWMNRVVSIRPQVSAVTVGETQDFNAPTTMGLTSHATLTPAEIAAQVTITKRDLETDPHGAQAAASYELGAAIATKIDVDLIGNFATFATDLGDGASSSATFENVAAGIAVVRNTTKNSDGIPVVVLHPYHWHDLWLELGKPAANLPNLDSVTSEALRNYFMATLMGGVSFYTSSNIAVDGSDDAISGIFTRSAIYLDTRRAMTMETPEYDASARAWELNVNAGYATGLVRATYGVKFTADALAPA